MKVYQILVIEDNPADVRLIREALRMHRVEHQLHLISDGAGAMSYIESAEPERIPDLLLLDLNLPIMGGSEVLKLLRARPAWSAVPVIIVSSSDAPKDRERMDGLQVACYFRKPSDLHEFMTLGQFVRDVLEQTAKSNG